MTDEKVELFSPQWLELARDFLTARIKEVKEPLDGLDFAICEVLTDPPAHLAHPGTNRVAWHVIFKGRHVEVGSGEIDCPFKMVSDYQTVLPRAKTVYSENPEAFEARKEDRPADLPEVPPEIQPLLVEMHDYQATRLL